MNTASPPDRPAESGLSATQLAGLAAIGVRGTAIRQRSEPVAGLPSKAAEPDEHTDATIVCDLGALAYELLDAHADTALLAADLACDPRWAVHLDYLQALHRKGREALAYSLVRLAG